MLQPSNQEGHGSINKHYAAPIVDKNKINFSNVYHDDHRPTNEIAMVAAKNGVGASAPGTITNVFSP